MQLGILRVTTNNLQGSFLLADEMSEPALIISYYPEYQVFQRKVGQGGERRKGKKEKLGTKKVNNLNHIRSCSYHVKLMNNVLRECVIASLE